MDPAWDNRSLSHTNPQPGHSKCMLQNVPRRSSRGCLRLQLGDRNRNHRKHSLRLKTGYLLLCLMFLGCGGSHESKQEIIIIYNIPYFVTTVPSEPVVVGNTWTYKAIAKPYGGGPEDIKYTYQPNGEYLPGLTWDKNTATLKLVTSDSTPIGDVNLGFIGATNGTAYGEVRQFISIRVISRP